MQADDKTVDIDTSGPGAEVQLEENKKPENETVEVQNETTTEDNVCLLYTSPSPRDRQKSRMPSSA